MLINNNFSSPNFTERKERIEYVILHFTELTFKSAVERLCDKESEVSAHYIIKEDGEIFQLVADEKVAWHAGISSWHGKNRLNQNSIGIELDNLGDRNFSKVQMRSCIKLCNFLAKKHNVPKENFIGHSDIAPGRKIDPGIFFDWKLLYSQGFGVWHNLDPVSLYIDLYKFGFAGEALVTVQTKLRKLGYNIEINGTFDQQTNYVVRAFQSKFCPNIIRDLGLPYYKNLDSKYAWNSYSDDVLDRLIKL